MLVSKRKGEFFAKSVHFIIQIESYIGLLIRKESVTCNIVSVVSNNDLTCPHIQYHSETHIASMIGGGVAASGAGGLYPRELCGRT